MTAPESAPRRGVPEGPDYVRGWNDALVASGGSVLLQIHDYDPSAPRPVPETAARCEHGFVLCSWCSGIAHVPAPPVEPVEEAQRCRHCGHLESDQVVITDDEGLVGGDVLYCVPCGPGHGVHNFEPPVEVEDEGNDEGRLIDGDSLRMSVMHPADSNTDKVEDEGSRPLDELRNGLLERWSYDEICNVCGDPADDRSATYRIEMQAQLVEFKAAIRKDAIAAQVERQRLARLGEGYGVGVRGDYFVEIGGANLTAHTRDQADMAMFAYQAARTRAEAAEGARDEFKRELALMVRLVDECGPLMNASNGNTDSTGSIDEGDVLTWRVIEHARALTAESVTRATK